VAPLNSDTQGSRFRKGSVQEEEEKKEGEEEEEEEET
jgi:hypothetical protein